MSNTAIQLKKSGVSGNTPSGLSFGEVALNYADGRLYYKNSGGGTSYIYNQLSFDTIIANGSILFAGSGSDTLSFAAGNNITISTNTVTKTITINAVDSVTDARAYAHANAAFDAANSSISGSNDSWARGQANASYTAQNTTALFANSAYAHANAAYAKANTGTTALDVNADIVAFTIAFS